MEQKAIAVFVMLGLLAAGALYTFDPWLGVALGMAAVLMGGVFLIAARAMKEPEKRRFTSDFSLDEEEPLEPKDNKSSRSGSHY